MPSTVPPTLQTGLPSIDAEHGALIESLRRLHLAPTGQARSEAFLEIISQLGQQLIQHFGNEEKHLNSCGMPAAEVHSHFRAHNTIIEQYAQLQYDLMAGKHLDQATILSMVQHWITTHITTHDLKLRQHIAN